MNGGHLSRFWTLLQRSCRLRCPVCGQGHLFQTWFRMSPTCSHCAVSFEREGGFFLGSIYLNYGLTALISAIFYPLCLFNRILDKTTLMVICVAFSILFPIWFFRYARSLWLGFDHFADPQDF